MGQFISKEEPVAQSLQNCNIQIEIMENAPTAAMEKNFMEELPDEILLKIMGYLSNKDVLKNVTLVSKRFHRLSKDPHIIKKIEFKSSEFSFGWSLLNYTWTDERKEKFYNDFFEVLRNAQKLKFLSLELDVLSTRRNWILPCHCLEELCIQFRNFHLDIGRYADTVPVSYTDFLGFLESVVFKVLYQCSKLKILKIECEVLLPLKTIASFNSKSLQELHVNINRCDPFPRVNPIDLKIFLNLMTENLPKIQYFGLTMGTFSRVDFLYKKICQEISSEKKIKIEIRNSRDGTKCVTVPQKVKSTYLL